jgi:hypothetical protein
MTAVTDASEAHGLSPRFVRIDAFEPVIRDRQTYYYLIQRQL